jgi:hypothetical protein
MRKYFLQVTGLSFSKIYFWVDQPVSRELEKTHLIMQIRFAKIINFVHIKLNFELENLPHKIIHISKSHVSHRNAI